MTEVLSVSQFIRSWLFLMGVFSISFPTPVFAGKFQVGDLIYQESSERLGTIAEIKDGKYLLRLQDEEDNPPKLSEESDLRPMDEDEKERWSTYMKYRKEIEDARAARKAEQESTEKNRAMREKLSRTPSNLVYASNLGENFFRGVKGGKRAGETLIYWEDDEEPTWVSDKNVRPRKGHGLKLSQIGDRPLTAVEKAAQEKASAKRAADAKVRCPRFKTYLDCTTTFEPCLWNTAENTCGYRGY
jgi:hypothetical protein